MLAALVKALAVIGVNVGDVCTQTCNELMPCWPDLGMMKAIQEIIDLCAG